MVPIVLLSLLRSSTSTERERERAANDNDKHMFATHMEHRRI